MIAGGAPSAPAVLVVAVAAFLTAIIAARALARRRRDVDIPIGSWWAFVAVVAAMLFGLVLFAIPWIAAALEPPGSALLQLEG